MDFCKLHLTAAYPIQLHVVDKEGNKGRYFCRYIGCVKNKSIMVSPLVTGGRDIDLSKDRSITARFMIGRGICVFPTRVIHQQHKPIAVMYLEYPVDVEFKAIRNA